MRDSTHLKPILWKSYKQLRIFSVIVVTSLSAKKHGEDTGYRIAVGLIRKLMKNYISNRYIHTNLYMAGV